MKLKAFNQIGKRDVVITTVPLVDSTLPLMAPAALKPVVESLGLSCLAVDLNAEVFKHIQESKQASELTDFFFDGVSHPDVIEWFEDFFISSAKEIVKYDPKIVGLSIFSHLGQHSAKWMAIYIKKLDPSIKIIVGGPGCLNTFSGPSKYVNDLLEEKIYDYHIRGDGEHSLYEFLKGNEQFPGINSLEWQEMTRDELNKLPAPDYSDYDMSLYLEKTIPIIGSRGCVRRCTFCDYIANWKKFQWRDADDIYAEMVKQHKIYGITYFKFQDSLTNGNQKEFRRLCQLLSTHNKENENKFRWSGYYIFREWSNSSEKDWQLVKESGADILIVGLENLNEDIRFHMGKKFSNQAVDLHLDQAKQHDITLVLLNIVGYVNETRKHIDYARTWLEDHTDHIDHIWLGWGGTLGIFPNTHLEANKEKLGIEMIGTQPQDWENKEIGSTPKLRAEWAKELVDLSSGLGYRIQDDPVNHHMLETMIRENE